METNHGLIEHERNRNQGKRPDQYESSAFILVGAALFLIATFLFIYLGSKLKEEQHKQELRIEMSK